ncbi:MAG: PA0069 family radical SAM protein [Zetaproteobacteria bacterium]|nr:MAG: PA0069 family radical SAM protein [Zetaproteobacteria bacterium]
MRKAKLPKRGATLRIRPRFAEVWADETPDPDPRTEYIPEPCRSAISRNNSPDVPFSLSINPYRGCEHGCIYCFARPTHAYWDLSPGTDFETKIFYKPNIADQLVRDLAKIGRLETPIAVGINTDAYQPIERKLKLTRRILSVLWEARAPCTIVTKSALIVRDLDLLAKMAQAGLVHVSFSISTLDAKLARTMEPRASTPSRRLWAMQQLAQAGVPVGVMAAPIIPKLTEHELEGILKAARAHGAQWAAYVVLRLPHEIAPLFEAWLEKHRPDAKAAVLRAVRDLRAGKLYESTFGVRMTGRGPRAELIARRFALAHKALGFAEPPALDLARFRPPGQGEQISLF